MSAPGKLNKDWLSRKEAAAYLTAEGYPIAPRTLARMAARKEGPPYRRILNRIAAYNRLALIDWAKSVTVEV